MVPWAWASKAMGPLGVLNNDAPTTCIENVVVKLSNELIAQENDELKQEVKKLK